jgi:high affinity Mn2+ porin
MATLKLTVAHGPEVFRRAMQKMKTANSTVSVTMLIGACAAALVESPRLFAGDGQPGGTNVVESAGVIENTNAVAATTNEEAWNWHVVNTDVADWHPHFPALYTGPNSLSSTSQAQETLALDLLAGVRLWRGAEFHADVLTWQGYGFNNTLGAEGFPNGNAVRAGTTYPNVVFSRVFIRQTIGLGGDQETVEDDLLALAGKEDISRITITVGKLNVKDIFDNNTYANDPSTQFLNWAFMANEAWDYPADSIGFTTGMAVEWNEPKWTVRYGFFQMPKVSNGLAQDEDYLQAWGMVTEVERRWAIEEHPGAVRALAYLNQAHMGSYAETVDDPAFGENITQTAAYRHKYGFGLNAEQELMKNVGMFMRAGWSDGRNEAWAFTDVDRTASLGLSIKGEFWHRADDTVGLAGAVNGISGIHQAYLAAGGTGILGGDGALTYGWEHLAEVYYDWKIWKTIHATADYQYIVNPAFNQNRGPVSVFSARLHWSF